MTSTGAGATLDLRMVLFNYGTRELTAKIVYYGPGMCGKTTNLQFVYDSLPSTNRSKMLSLATQTDRTLFFDFLPIDLGKIRGMRTRMQLYTVPGQVCYNQTRQLVLKGADGVVFVADSQDSALDANLESLQNLEDNLRKQGIRIAEIPLVLQYNKRDLPTALPVAALDAALNRLKVRSFESIATTGMGVEATANGIAQIVLAHLARKYGLERAGELERELQVLNPNPPGDPRTSAETVWLDESVSAAPQEPKPAALADTPPPAPEPELAFEELIERFETAGAGMQFDRGTEAAAAPIEFDFDFPGEAEPATAAAAVQVPEPRLTTAAQSLQAFEPQQAATPVAPAPILEPPPPQELVREITLPLNLTMDELRRHRKMKLRITLEVNLLK